MEFDHRAVIARGVRYDNRFLENNYWRMSLLLVTGVFMGYTLQPVPKWLSHLFDTSNLLKFCVLFLAGSIAVYPLNPKKMVWVTIGSLVTLMLFDMARKYDQYLDKQATAKKKEVSQEQQQQPMWLAEQIAAAEASGDVGGSGSQ